MAGDLHVADVGTVITVTITDSGSAVNISTATVKQLWLGKPPSAPGQARTVLTKTATFTTDGSDGKIYWTIIAGDLDTAGMWSVQGYVEMPTGKWHSDEIAMRVLPNVQ